MLTAYHQRRIAEQMKGGAEKTLEGAAGALKETAAHAASAAETAKSAASDAAGAASGVNQAVRIPILDRIARTIRKSLFDLGKEVAARAEGILDNTGSVIVDGTVGVLKNIGEGLEDFFVRGPSKILKGEIGEGLKDMVLAPVKIFVQTPLDWGLLAGGKTISSLQTAFGLEPAGRKLTDEEKAELQKVYGDQIDYDKVRVKEGPNAIFSIHKLFGAQPPGFVMGNTIYLPTKGGTKEARVQWLCHEAGHVWQHQHGGTDYMSEALFAQALEFLRLGPGYDFTQSINEGASWEELNPEQQADLMSEAYGSGYFDNDDPDKKFIYVDGDGNSHDLTSAVEEGHDQVQQGEGAP